jgi:transposase
VLPGQLVRALGVGARGIKTDQRDAEVLARASVRNEQLPSVHLRSERSRSRREVISARATLLQARKSLALSVKSWLRGRLMVLRGRASSKHFAEAVRAAALSQPEGLPAPLELLLQSFEQLCDQIEKLDEQAQQLADSDPVCQRLMTMPGVGPQVSLAFTTHLDDPQRFAASDQLASYLALVPGESTTGGKLKRTGTIHAGPLYLKALLVQSAWVMWRYRPNDPLVLWARAIADKRGKRIAIVALARKIATILWAMWKHQRSYEPQRASSVRAPQPAATVG